MRYRSEPCSVKVCDATADGQSACHWGDASPGAGAGGPKRQVLPMLVSSNGRFRCVSQLSPATAVTVASLLTLPFCAAVPERHAVPGPDGLPAAYITLSRLLNLHRFMKLSILMRSEERRVGKECRSRWSPYH